MFKLIRGDHTIVINLMEVRTTSIEVSIMVLEEAMEVVVVTIVSMMTYGSRPTNQ